MNTFYYRELANSDIIFPGVSDNFNSFRNDVTADRNYDNDVMRTYVFRDIQQPVYFVVDGIANRSTYANMDVLRHSFGQRDKKGRGIFIVKTYQFTSYDMNELRAVVNYWYSNNPDLDLDVKRSIKRDLETYLKCRITSHLKIRLVNYISYSDLADNNIVYNSLLGGYLTKDLKRYDLDFHKKNTTVNNKIEISLNSDHSDYWLTLGDNIIQLEGNDSVEKNKIRVLNGSSCVMEYDIKNLEEYNIFDNKKEAYNSRISTNLKMAKLENEGEKIYVEKQKIRMDNNSLKVKILSLKQEINKLGNSKFDVGMDTIISKFVSPLYLLVLNAIFNKRK